MTEPKAIELQTQEVVVATLRPTPTPGQIWQHWQRGLVEILGVSEHPTKGYVVYKSLSSKDLEVRSLDNFLANLGDKGNRFELLREARDG